MKIFFDTNVYVAEALLGRGTAQLIEATRRGRWRMYVSRYVLDEVAHVLVDEFEFSPRFAKLSQARIARRAILVHAQSRAAVPDDIKDSPILQAALSCSADYLVSNDRHLLVLDPFQSLRVISMRAYRRLLRERGLIG